MLGKYAGGLIIIPVCWLLNVNPVHAQSTSAGCAAINAGAFDHTTTSLLGVIADQTLEFFAGDTVTVVAANTTFTHAFINGAFTLFGTEGTGPRSETRMGVVPSDGTYRTYSAIQAINGLTATITWTCTPGGTTDPDPPDPDPPSPPTPGTDAAMRMDINRSAGDFFFKHDLSRGLYLRIHASELFYQPVSLGPEDRILNDLRAQRDTIKRALEERKKRRDEFEQKREGLAEQAALIEMQIDSRRRFLLVNDSPLPDAILDSLEDARNDVALELRFYEALLELPREQVDALEKQLQEFDALLNQLQADQNVYLIPPGQSVNFLSYPPANPPGPASISPLSIVAQNERSGGFTADLTRLLNGSATLPGDRRTRFWLSGNISVLDDRSSADRTGHVGHLSLGAARRIGERFALSGSLTARAGEYSINSVQSQNDYAGVALAASGAYRLTETLSLTASGFAERGHFDATVGAATGSYNATIFGLSGGIEGFYTTSGFVLQPEATLSYLHYELDGYTDSTGVAVPGQTSETGAVSTALTVSQPRLGAGRLKGWEPYVTGRLQYYFEDTGPVVLTPTASFDDGRILGTFGAGADFNFDNDAKGGLGISYSDAFDGDIGTFNFGARLTVPLN